MRLADEIILANLRCGGPPSDKGPGSGNYEHKHKSLPEESLTKTHAYSAPQGLSYGDLVPNWLDNMGHVSKSAQYSKDEKRAITAYQNATATHAAINRILTGQKTGSSPKITDYITSIDSAMLKSTVNKPIEVWRGLSGEYSDKVYKDLLDGSRQIDNKTYQSTSVEQRFAHDFATGNAYAEGMDQEYPGVVLQIHVPAGTHAIAIKGTEGEILLDRGITYHVNKLFSVKVPESREEQEHRKKYGNSVSETHRSVLYADVTAIGKD